MVAGLEQGCVNQMVLEDDTFFDATASLVFSRVETFLESGLPYDLLQLGWVTMPWRISWVKISRMVPPVPCFYKLSGRWTATHAYIMSRSAMLQEANASYSFMPIDVYYSQVFKNVVTTPPVCAFQRCHKSSIPLPLVDEFRCHIKANSTFQHIVEDAVYNYSGLLGDCK